MPNNNVHNNTIVELFFLEQFLVYSIVKNDRLYHKQCTTYYYYTIKVLMSTNKI